jgi:hypothetical protein
MLRAFFDESGTDPRGPAFIMGGFLANCLEWERAAEAWDICLHESPSINAFHHADAERLSGEFLGWGKIEADAKVLSLAKVIGHFQLQGFVTAISHSWFGPRDKRAAKGMFGTRIYDHAFLKVVSCVVHHVADSIPGSDKVDFIFERRLELKQCKSMFEELRDSLQPTEMSRAGTCSDDSGDDNVALQMADLLSWEFLQVVDRNHQSESFKCINDAHPVFYLPCTPPKWLPYLLALQSFGQCVKDDADGLQKRAYGERERSLKIIEDTQELIFNKVEFDSRFMDLCKFTGSENYLAEFVKDNEATWERIRRFQELLSEIGIESSDEDTIKRN